MDWEAILNSALSRDPEQPAKLGLRSAAAEWLNLPQLTSWSPGRVEARWHVDERVLNSRGELFGGYYGVLADSVLALVAMTVLTSSEHFKTSDLRLSFFRPVAEGELTIAAVVINRSRTLVHVEAEFRDPLQRLLAKASAVQSVYPVEGKS